MINAFEINVFDNTYHRHFCNSLRWQLMTDGRPFIYFKYIYLNLHEVETEFYYLSVMRIASWVSYLLHFYYLSLWLMASWVEYKRTLVANA